MISTMEAIWVLSWIGAVITVPSVLLQRRARPTAALSWLLALFALSPLTLIAWWLFGRTHLRRKRRRRRLASLSIEQSLAGTQRRMLNRHHAKPGLLIPHLAPNLPAGLSGLVFPASGGNDIRLLGSAAAAHQAWRGLIRGAEHHLHLLFYIWRDDETGRAFRDLLVDRAAQGVEVRVLYDSVGSLELPGHFFDPLRAAGGRVEAFMPIRLFATAPTLNFRNHRKLLIADGRRAYTGGINIGDEYLAWEDVGISIQGPGVNQIQEVFVDDWYFCTSEELTRECYFSTAESAPAESARAVCETIASGPDQTFNATRDMVFLAVTQSRRRLWIATPYFVPDTALLLALRTAVYRGVDVRLFLPACSDTPLVRYASRAFYPGLLEGGVRIFEYPGMLHAKAMQLDAEAVLIGSANLDTRSFRLNFELSTFVTSADVSLDLARLFEGIRARSHEIGGGDIQQTSYVERLRDALAHLLSPLL